MTDTGSRPAASNSPPDRVLAPIVEVEKGFTADECARIVSFGLSLPLAKGEATSPTLAPTARNSTVAFFAPTAESQWIFERIFELVSKLNRQYWQFEVSGSERIQFSRYTEGEFYDWHMDLGGRGPLSRRKVTVTVQLSEAGEYDGGELEVNMGAIVRAASKQKGALVAFPSYALHRVLPITRGVRFSLSAWFGGQTAFR